MLKKVAWFLILLTTGVACLDEPDCFSLNNNLVGISFRKMYDGAQDTVALVSVTIAGTDSVFYEYQLRNGLDVPLNYLAPQTDATLQFANLITGETFTRTLQFTYDAKAQFVSEDCGERFVLSNLDVAQHDFDSLRVLSGTPARLSGGSQVYVYRCPITNLVKFNFRQWYADTVSNGKALDVNISGINADYTPFLFNEMDTASSVKLPLNPAANTTRFDLSFDTGDKFITLGYSVTPATILTVCGEQNVYSDLEVIDHDFEIMKVNRDSLRDPAITNVSFYRCPETHLMKVQFKRTTATNAANDTLNITSINAAHFGAPLTFTTPQTAVTLPLDTLNDTSSFDFTIEGVTTTLTVTYTRASRTFHEVCNQTIITGLAATTPAFGTITVTNEDIKFPIVTNLHIVKN